ncbi:hypothetical protein RhiJN_23148 [Ceratobasidium sp. AG-Ba]|nr:hypothetical protein RhiJN_23148 [Ceratobasidium sp. AG-Ba]
MHESVLSDPALSVVSDHAWDNSYQVDSVPPSPTLDPGQRTPVTAEPMGGTANRRESMVSVPTTSTSTPTSATEPPPRPNDAALADSSYNFEDGNVTVQIEQCLFRVHEFKLKEFEDLKGMLQGAQKDEDGRKTIYLTANPSEFRRMLAVLYSCGYDRPTFTTGTLKASLRFATLYKHTSIRDYAIRHLEKRTLPPIERFALARDCEISAWMGPALDDLCWREEPISVDEAQVLGFEKFAEVASRREAVKYERGSRLKLEMMDESAAGGRTPPSREPLPLPSTSTSTTAESVTSEASPAPGRLIVTNHATKSPSSPSIVTSNLGDSVELGVPFGLVGTGGLSVRGRSTVRPSSSRGGGFRGFRGRGLGNGYAAPRAMSQAEETAVSEDSDDDM